MEACCRVAHVDDLSHICAGVVEKYNAFGTTIDLRLLEKTTRAAEQNIELRKLSGRAHRNIVPWEADTRCFLVGHENVHKER